MTKAELEQENEDLRAAFIRVQNIAADAVGEDDEVHPADCDCGECEEEEA